MGGGEQEAAFPTPHITVLDLTCNTSRTEPQLTEIYHTKNVLLQQLIIVFLFNAVSCISDPVFVPQASRKGSGLDSFTVGWSKPDEKIREFIGRYHLSLVDPISEDVQELFVPPEDSDHMFTDLKPATNYTFKV